MILEKILFLPSTPLNVLVASAVAIQWQTRFEMEIWLIDQKRLYDNPYHQALMNWRESPFKNVRIFPGNSKGVAKLKERQENFENLRLALDEFEPNQIAVGSDRRIEFQYALYYLQKKGKAAKGVYLDDGLYSYSGRQSHFVKDRLNSWLKKIVYGYWWEEPVTVGSSSLIEEAWLFQPHLAICELTKKNCFQIDTDWFKLPPLLGLSDTLSKILGVQTSEISELHILILIPHPNNLKKITSYEKRIKALVDRLGRQGKKIGIKYHPRMHEEDELGLRKKGASQILSTQMAFEFYLPMLGSDCEVIGDIGTALLTTKWLRPDLKVRAVLDEKESFQKKFIPLIEAMDIELLSDYGNLT